MATKKTDKFIEPIDADFDEVAGAVAKSTHRQKTSKIKKIALLPALLPTGLKPQAELFHVDKQAELNGIEMGVLESGVPYLSGRGLASMCGLDHTSLLEMANNWGEQKLKPRGRQINQLLEQAGYFESELYLRSEHKGTEISAYTEPVCLAILEYFAFVAPDPRKTERYTLTRPKAESRASGRRQRASQEAAGAATARPVCPGHAASG